MRSESLSGQLERIGRLATASVLIAAALATFALLHRIVPPTAPTRAPQTVPVKATPISAAPASAAAASATATAKGVDPLQAAQLQTLHALTRAQEAQVTASRKRAAAEKQSLSKLATQPRQPASRSVGRRLVTGGHTLTIPAPTTSETGAAPGTTKTGGSYHSTGGASASVGSR